MFLAVDAEAPVTHAEDQAGIDQQPRVALEIVLHAAATKARTLGDDLSAGTPAEARCGEHVLPRGNGLLEDLGVDLLLEAIVGPDVAVVGLRALAVAEVLG